jgi:hypothetical protein
VIIARSQAAAPWVPSRHRFAIFRAVAFVRLLRSGSFPERGSKEDGVVLAIDRDQSTAENYTVGIFVWLVVSSFFAALLSARLVLAAAVLIALPLGALAVSAAVVIAGLVFAPVSHALGVPRGPSNITLNSTGILMVVTLAASYFAASPAWVRVPAWIFLGAIVLNGLCSAALFVMRARLRGMELRCAG